MAKKQTTRKPNISAETLERARREMAGGAPVVSTPTPNQTSVKSSVGQNKNDNVIIRSSSKKRTMSQEELSHEYGYVLRDLRSMGVLAFALFIGMVVVSLIINQIA
ncbi:MAG: hypothetical protein F9K46_11595 [Anaerolineae bacterium]|nr:MAG: hypothetical protein F9K46_11595 [Anaerolineae bacterium]